jgi:hypothetical protein
VYRFSLLYDCKTFLIVRKKLENIFINVGSPRQKFNLILYNCKAIEFSGKHFERLSVIIFKLYSDGLENMVSL